MRKHLAILLGTLFMLFGCDMFISRGGEGQPCFSETDQCSGDLTCYKGRCVREVPDAGQDGGDEPEGDDGGNGADDGGNGADDGGEDDGDQPATNPVDIYRSVGPGNDSSMAGEQNGSTLSFSNSRATFPYALPAKVGVGDVIQYDTDNNQTPDALVFIHERISGTEVRIANADGTPMNLTRDTNTWGVLRAYTSLSDAIMVEENLTVNASLRDFDDKYATEDPRDLVNRDTVWNIACYADAVDESRVSITNTAWNTDESHYLRIFTPVGITEAGETQRHSGAWSDSAYILAVTISQDWISALQIGGVHVHIDGLQLHKTGDVASKIVQGIEVAGSSHLWLSNSIIRGDGSEGQGVLLDGSGAVLYMWNAIVYLAAQTQGDGIFIRGGPLAFIYNVTLYNNNRGIYVEDNNTTNLHIKNTIAVGNSDFDFDSGAAFGDRSYNNCSSDGTAGANGMTDGVTGAEPLELFEGHTSIPPNLHLKLDASCNNVGLNLKDDPDLNFTNDIDGDPRPVDGTAWDIGADENGQ